jgi:hypothetical protein
MFFNIVKLILSVFILESREPGSTGTGLTGSTCFIFNYKNTILHLLPSSVSFVSALAIVVNIIKPVGLYW